MCAGNLANGSKYSLKHIVGDPKPGVGRVDERSGIRDNEHGSLRELLVELVGIIVEHRNPGLPHDL